jgi:hypothetical protein
MTTFFETLIRPDQDELDNMDRREVGRAANVLQIGEFQLLQLAYREWHDEDLPESRVDALFHDYMIHSDVPHWARHYARQILRLDEAGRLDDNDRRYHLYDQDTGSGEAPHGLRKFCIAAGIVTLIFGSGVMGAVMTTGKGATNFPPYVSEKDLAATPDELTQGAGPAVKSITGGARGSGS